MNATERLAQIENLAKALKNEPAKIEDPAINDEILDLSYSLLMDIKVHKNTGVENRKASKIIIQCLPKDSLKLELMKLNLSEAGMI